MKKRLLYLLSFILLIIGSGLIFTYFYCMPIFNDNILKNIEVLSYDENNNTASVSVTFDNKYDDLKCGYGNSKDIINYENVNDGICKLDIGLSDANYIYVKRSIFTNKFNIDDIVLDVQTFNKIYLALNETIEINPEVKSISKDFTISLKSNNEDIVSVDGNKITGEKVGSTLVDIYVNDNKMFSTTVSVTSLINIRSKKFDDDKSYLPCEKYSKEEADKLDDILKVKIENVGGYGTRAAVVEAMRFLLLDFPYKIDYFFENGRLSGGVNYVDGEGRYYHRGLYLHSSKFEEIEKSFSGPAIWGCPLRNFEDYPPKFVEGGYNSNGLDCSGFVTWAIYNGGFDVGDRGAGDSLEDDSELNDVGEKVQLTDELMYSGKVKAGDLLGIWGHIAIIIGIDDDNVYVAESLWTYGGVVINTYEKDKLDDEFVQVVLMDDVYKEDGLYTDMWY